MKHTVQETQTCPACHRGLKQDEICCALVHYTWRCKHCLKVTSGFVVPYGKCTSCGGALEAIAGSEIGQTAQFQAIRDAVQFELNAYHFYKIARDKTRHLENVTLLEHLYTGEIGHLHELEEKYHAHLPIEIKELTADEVSVLSSSLFQGIEVKEDAGLMDLYRVALTMERHTRDHFKHLADSLPPGREQDICLELAAEEEEHVAILEKELAKLGSAALRRVGFKTGIRCSRLDWSQDFYTRVLGFRVLREWIEDEARGCLLSPLEDSSVQFEIYEEKSSAAKPGKSSGRPPASSRVDVQLRTDSLTEWVDRLSGVWSFDGPEELPWGQRQIRLRDPDNLHIVIYEEK